MRGFARTDEGFNKFMNAISWLFTLFTIVMVAFTTISLKSRDEHGAQIFGYRLFVVLSDSMSLTDKNADLNVHFNAGDVAVVKELTAVEKAGLKAGDVISFVSTNPDSKDKVVTHMIREVRYDENGKVIGYTTYGTATNTDDEEMAEFDKVLGKYEFTVPSLGSLLDFIKTPKGYLTCIFMPFVILIGWYGIKIFRLLREI